VGTSKREVIDRAARADLADVRKRNRFGHIDRGVSDPKRARLGQGEPFSVSRWLEVAARLPGHGMIQQASLFG